jgi:hypothetical protein
MRSKKRRIQVTAQIKSGGFTQMNACTFVDFMQVLKPWLNDDYIYQARFDNKGNFTLIFVDGGQKDYRVDDCTASQLKDVVELMKKNGVAVLK